MITKRQIRQSQGTFTSVYCKTPHCAFSLPYICFISGMKNLKQSYTRVTLRRHRFEVVSADFLVLCWVWCYAGAVNVVWEQKGKEKLKWNRSNTGLFVQPITNFDFFYIIWYWLPSFEGKNIKFIRNGGLNLGRLFSVIFLVILALMVKSTHIGFKCTEGADPRVYSGRGGRCLFRNHPPPLSRFDTEKTRK